MCKSYGNKAVFGIKNIDIKSVICTNIPDALLTCLLFFVTMFFTHS